MSKYQPRLVLPFVLWMIIIGALSSDWGSGETMLKFMPDFLKRLFLEPSTQELRESLFVTVAFWIIRKIGHFIAYGTMAILCVRWLRAVVLRQQTIWLVTILVCFAYAVLDETHQYFLPTRTGSAFDVGIDWLSTVIAMWLYLRHTHREESLKAVKNRRI